MKSPGKQRAVGFASKSPAPVSANFTPENKLDFIRKGKKINPLTSGNFKLTAER